MIMIITSHPAPYQNLNVSPGSLCTTHHIATTPHSLTGQPAALFEAVPVPSEGKISRHYTDIMRPWNLGQLVEACLERRHVPQQTPVTIGTALDIEWENMWWPARVAEFNAIDGKCLMQYEVDHSVSVPLAHSHTYSLTYSPTHSLTHSHTHPPTQSYTRCMYMDTL